MYCKNCGQQIDKEQDAAVCPNCGKETGITSESEAVHAEKVPEAEIKPYLYCPYCGTELVSESCFCTRCGGRVIPYSAQSRPMPSTPYYITDAQKKPGKLYSILAMIFSFLYPFIGIVLGAFAILKGKKGENKTAIILGIVAIVISVLMAAATIALAVITRGKILSF